MPARHNLFRTHRYSLLRNVIECTEPSLSHLLHPTPLIKVHDLVCLICIEVSGRIIERDMAVLADSDDAYVNLILPQLLRQLPDIPLDIALAIDEIGRLEIDLGNEPLLEILPEARTMALGKGDILIKMEHLHL